ncbi:DUF461 domain-containing protein [Streptomyces sp. URMC 124]|uniref:DUF461 domain-containing protein n=1 Tax=Streptomyces sp. URMC 124 TaxID=3423405 RepID=UPI003F1D0C27
MSSSLRRGALAATVLVLSIASLSACAAGNSAQTLEVKPDNAATSVGDIKLQNMNVITQPDRNAKGPAVITGQVFNNGREDQTLRGITLTGKNGAKVKLTPAKGSGDLVVPAGGSVLLGGKGNAAAVLPDGREALKDGEQQKLSFDFSETGEVRIGAFVVPATSYFKDWGPSEAAPTPAAKPGGAKPSGEPGEPSTAPSGAPSGAPAGAAGKPSGAAASPGTGQASQSGQQHAGH